MYGVMMSVTKAILILVTGNTLPALSRVRIAGLSSVAAGLEIFRCTSCTADLSFSADVTRARCPRCGREYVPVGGVVDFVCTRDSGDERAYYDEYYRAHAPH